MLKVLCVCCEYSFLNCVRVLLSILKYVGSALGYVDTKNACTGRILGSTLHALCLRVVFGKLEVLLGIFIVL